ncbi:integrase [Rhodanobacter thiooxydans]|uniref:Integrase n=1 Tax=Rhodanobacter thiooxydans TaxID=416169 RepID=A0A154QEE4_9GAMM|nr:DNA-binding protein [Rhodanobacter thiooxydans]KZC22657.1 integrase [Rhodanobacter thiooxydans]
MSRVSDTRQRTREAAVQLVAGGKRPHEITVDLVYAAIQQGSRTTINDELKQWKDERTKADALGADLPAAIADAMRTLWVTAVEQGEVVFAEQRGALETALAHAEQQQATISQERDSVLATSRALTEECEALRQQIGTLQAQVASEVASKNQALQDGRALQQKLIALQAETAEQIERIRETQGAQAEEFQAAIASRDTAFQAERDKANERLEVAQARMLQEIDAAREGQRRAESQLTKARERLEQQQASLAELRLDAGRHRRELAERDNRLETLAKIVTDRDRTVVELATARGQLEGMATAMQSLETRATTAESRITDLLAERVPLATARNKRGKQRDV